MRSIGLLGFGEVGQRLADDLARLPDLRLRAYDLQFGDADSGPSAALRERPSIEQAASATELATGCPLVIAAIKQNTEPRSSVAQVLPCYRVLDQLRAKLRE